MGHVSHRFHIAMMAAVALVGLAACGGEDDPGLPGTAPDAIATPGQVRAHLTFVASQIPIPRPQPAYVPNPFQCTASGTREVTAATVASPFTDEPVATERIRYRDCMQYSGPADDPGSEFSRRHGLEETADTQLPNGARVTYQGLGETPGTAFQRQLRAVSQGGVYEEDHYILSRTHGMERATFFGFVRRRELATFVSHELGIRYPDGARFEGRYSFGSEATAFRITSRNDLWDLAGEYAIETARCHTGALRVETQRELAYDPNTDRFVAGTLRFLAGEGTATAAFNADGTVTLTGAQGGQLTEPWSPGIVPWESDCFAAEDP